MFGEKQKSRKFIPFVSCNLAFHAIFVFYAVFFFASYTQCVICVICCYGKIISNFGKNKKLSCDFKGIYGINYIFLNLHTVCQKNLGT